MDDNENKNLKKDLSRFTIIEPPQKIEIPEVISERIKEHYRNETSIHIEGKKYPTVYFETINKISSTLIVYSAYLTPKKTPPQSPDTLNKKISSIVKKSKKLHDDLLNLKKNAWFLLDGDGSVDTCTDSMREMIQTLESRQKLITVGKKGDYTVGIKSERKDAIIYRLIYELSEILNNAGFPCRYDPVSEKTSEGMKFMITLLGLIKTERTPQAIQKVIYKNKTK